MNVTAQEMLNKFSWKLMLENYEYLPNDFSFALNLTEVTNTSQQAMYIYISAQFAKY
jgi:hypothetical protein